ncbi:HAD family hydrolase [Laedolimicola ammoniilytica]|uniref:HAD family hydrolase n=1 Tax=Laedolimicola ammoniilytica TaxID=2981771 RepID=A0ABT2RSJ9_9FIRM|nr:HAD family hydrolase [Laedolimicola ammoniilytica]MCU6695296.1 HAD family hydrolase [Laedolimicola ammoniilytica]SCG91064.1 Pyrophosphatase ppaX [uncultured Clostridium sp.]
MIKGILFDKDGTLIDFYEVWGKAAVKVAKRLCDARRMPERQRMLLREMGVADGRVDPDGALAWKSYRGVAEDLQEYLGTDSEKLAGELAELFYEEVGLKRTAYPTFTDVKAMMEALRSRGLWIGVATTDDLKSTRRCLEVLGVEEYISFWGVSGEGLPEKPDGRLVSLAAGHWGIWKDEIAMVGDNPNDMRFARNGGAVAIGVKSGTGTENMLREQADYLLDSVDDLVDLIDQINTEEKRNGTYSVKACV